MLRSRVMQWLVEGRAGELISQWTGDTLAHCLGDALAFADAITQ
jgi:hypothetical protein